MHAPHEDHLTTAAAPPSLDTLRERILAQGLLATVVIGGFAMPPNLWASLHGKNYLVALGDLMFYAWIVILWRAKALAYRTRALHFVGLFYLLAIMLTAFLGPTGVGLVWILTATTLAAALLGLRAAWIGLAVEIVVLVAVGVAFARAPAPFWVVPVQMPWVAWALFSANTVVLSAISSLSVASLLRGVSAAIDSREQAHRALAEEHQRLEAANEALRVEATRREAAEAQLRQTQKLEALGTLAGGMAHDFNNLLQPIVMLSALVKDELPPDSPLREDLEGVEAAATRGRDLVRRILHFSRRGPRARERVPLRAAIEESIALLSATLPASVVIRFDSALDDDVVYADPTEIQQVVLNLATNGAHAMRARGGALTIELTSVAGDPPSGTPRTGSGPGVRLTVRDEGEGMAPALVERIFEPFFTTKGPGQGTGLGLSVVHGIVTGMGGKIAVDSQVGRGTAIHVELPRGERTSLSAPTPAPSGPPTRALRLLVVDDDAQVSSAIRRALEQAGHRVTSAAEPRVAIARFTAAPDDFDAVITDFTMPGMTGLALATELRRVRPAVPIVLSTGRLEAGVEEEVARAGIALLHKPAQVEEVLRVVERVVRRAG